MKGQGSSIHLLEVQRGLSYGPLVSMGLKGVSRCVPIFIEADLISMDRSIIICYYLSKAMAAAK